MKRVLFEDVTMLSVGEVVEMKTHIRCGMVKYRIDYNDANGKTHTQWSDWMRDDGYKVGDDIPVKTLTVPGGFVSVLLEVDNVPQCHADLYSAAIIGMGVCALIAGYCIGKEKSKLR